MYDELYREFTSIWGDFNKAAWGDRSVYVLWASDRIMLDIEQLGKFGDFLCDAYAFSKTLEPRSALDLQVLLLDELIYDDIYRQGKEVPAGDQHTAPPATTPPAQSRPAAQEIEAAIAAQVETLIALPLGDKNKNLYEAIWVLASAAEGKRLSILAKYRDRLARAIIEDANNLRSFIKPISNSPKVEISARQLSQLFKDLAPDFKPAVESSEIDWSKEGLEIHWVP